MASVFRQFGFLKRLTDRKMNQNGKMAAVVLAGWLGVSVLADDWPQWLGEHRDGVWRETGIVEKFPEDGLPVVWRQPIGGGYSGPAVADGRVLVMDREAKAFAPETTAGNPNFVRAKIPGIERVICLEESTGKTLWQAQYESVYSTAYPYAIGPRCTPTVDGNRVYTLGAEGHLKCLAIEDGREIWSVDFRKTHQAKTPTWGFAAHPLVEGDRLFCMVGGEDSAVAAFDKNTGEELWRSGAAKDPGYCPPAIYSIGGKRQLIAWDSKNVRGLNPVSGEVFWSLPFPPTFGMSIGMPRLEGRRLFLMAFNRVSGMIEVAADSASAKLIWKGGTKSGVGGVLNTAWVEDGFIYACGHRGEYRCVELATGRRVWSSDLPAQNQAGQRASSWPNVFTVKHKPSGRFFLANDHGELILAELSPQGYREITRAQVIEPTHIVGGRRLVWSHPAFANRRLYLRNDREILCLSLAAGKPTSPRE